MQTPPPYRSPGFDTMREQARLDALARYDVLDTPPDETFDRLTRLAKHIFGVSMSTITFIDGHRQWFKSQQGMATCETDRAPAFCNVAIEQPMPLVVSDATADERFLDNPFVVGEPHVRFYAGMPLRAPGGHAIGTLCVIDPRPRDFSPQDQEILTDLGALAMEVLEFRRRSLSPGNGDAAGEAGQPGLAREFANGRSVLKAGRIVFNNSRAIVKCTVRQLSPDTAVVHVISTAKIPDRIALMIDADASSRLCSVSSRAEQHLALAFES
ncbi:GAF domain-containing protein [Bosea sp. NPDC055332]